MKLQEFSSLLKDMWRVALKSNFSIVAIWGIAVWMHTKVYVPYLREQMRHDLIKETRAELKDEILSEIMAKNLSLELKLSEEMDIPLYKVPFAIGRSVSITDSASRYYPLVRTVQRLEENKPVGLYLLGDKLRFRNLEGDFEPVRQDRTGVYRYGKDGKKLYIYLK